MTMHRLPCAICGNVYIVSRRVANGKNKDLYICPVCGDKLRGKKKKGVKK